MKQKLTALLLVLLLAGTLVLPVMAAALGALRLRRVHLHTR